MSDNPQNADPAQLRIDLGKKLQDIQTLLRDPEIDAPIHEPDELQELKKFGDVGTPRDIAIARFYFLTHEICVAEDIAQKLDRDETINQCEVELHMVDHELHQTGEGGGEKDAVQILKNAIGRADEISGVTLGRLGAQCILDGWHERRQRWKQQPPEGEPQSCLGLTVDKGKQTIQQPDTGHILELSGDEWTMFKLAFEAGSDGVAMELWRKHHEGSWRSRRESKRRLKEKIKRFGVTLESGPRLRLIIPE